MAGIGGMLDGLLGNMTGGQGLGGLGAGGLAQKAKGLWDGQSTLTKGAIAGGLLGVLLSGNARRLVGTGVQVGGAALIGGLAYQAFSNWQSGKSAAGGDAVPSAQGTVFQPTDPVAAEELNRRLLQAMVAATKADGVITDAEYAAINAQMARLGLGAEAQTMISAELAAPLDIGRIAALARSPEEAAAIYTASLLVVNREGGAEKGYLAMLAARLGLEAGLVQHLDAGVLQAA
jgi:uncharacterized membrane protein YebE (DUF533 family)